MTDAAAAPVPTPKKILFTGSGGRLGRRVIPLLEAAGYEVVSADIGPKPEGAGPYVQLDIADFDQVFEACKGVDAIVHSAIASSRAFGIEDERFHPQEGKLEFDHASFSVNIGGTYNIYEAARRLGIRRVVFISSLTTVLGEGGWPLPAKPVPASRNVYAVTKLAGEQLGYVFSKTLGMSVICLRIGQPYPLHLVREPEWLASELGRSIFAVHEDTAQAIGCALNHPVAEYGLFPVTSWAAKPNVDLSEGEAFGFRPRFQVLEDGKVAEAPGR